jgi:hypothetical protein
MKPDLIEFDRAVTELFRHEGGSETFVQWYSAYREALSAVAVEGYFLELKDSDVTGDIFE